MKNLMEILDSASTEPFVPMEKTSFNSLPVGSCFVSCEFFVAAPYIKTGPESARRVDKESSDEFNTTIKVCYFDSEKEAIHFANERNEELLSAEEKKRTLGGAAIC